MRKILAALVLSGVFMSAHAVLPNPKEFAVEMENGNISLARTWLDSGMPASFAGSRIGSGMHIAAWEGNIELLELFHQYGANVNQMNSVGETPATLAAWKGKKKALEWLLSHGAKVNTPNKTWSPLHYAAFSGNTEVFDYLVDKGANINALSTNGSSVLMMAIYEGHVDIAKKLIGMGADTKPRNDWGDGAFEWAMRYNNTEIAKMIASPDEFIKAMNRPKSEWGSPTRSQRVSPELEELLRERQRLLDMDKPVTHLQRPIQEAHMRMIQNQQSDKPKSDVMFEITANRGNPQKQNARITEYATPGAIIRLEKSKK